MPAPEPDFIVASTVPPIRVALEPAHNALNSLLLLVKADKLSGLDTWVTRTADALTPEQRHVNHLVLIGVHFAVVPDRSFGSFPAYVDHLAALDPVILRNRVFNAYAQIPPKDEECCPPPDPTSEQVSINIAPLLEDVDVFLEFLKERFPVEHMDLEIESEAHRYLNDPPAMQALIVSHFRSMWEEFLSPEWDRVVPMLQASVDAFRQLSLGDLSRFEAVQLVLGRDIGKEEEEYWKAALEHTERLIFVPSTHLGPYIGKFRSGDTLWALFGARVPEGAHIHAPDLSRAEILVRLNALADDTRLRILKLISEGGELRSQEIMTRLELSQSAASRHLKQLSATGYLNERRCEGAKCYALNPKRVEDTLRAITAFLWEK
jgi:DNA-binding transcriptional ArsR family regulator